MKYFKVHLNQIMNFYYFIILGIMINAIKVEIFQ